MAILSLRGPIDRSLRSCTIFTMGSFIIRSNFRYFLSVCLTFSICYCAAPEVSYDKFENGIVVSTRKIASEIGAGILKQGGNAVDAAVAVSYALAVVHPEAGNIGGGGFMVVRLPDGRSTTIDYREKAPGRAHRDMFLDKYGEIVPDLSTFGALSVGVPGTVAGTMYALEKYGTMSRIEVLNPAIELAENGWILDRPMGGDAFKHFPSTNKIFNKPGGRPYVPGDLFVQKDLANTLKLIAGKDRDGFYKGVTAGLIVSSMEKHGGLVTMDDLEHYDAVERPPVEGTYHGYGILSMGPPSSGGASIIQLLHMLERYEIAALGHNTAETAHLMVEAERRVFADRAEYMGDSDFVEVPVKQLISKEYAAHRAASIDPEKTTPSSEIGHGDVTEFFAESEETTHFSVMDKNGMAVAVTTTLNGSYGSLLVTEGAGFLLNNEMDDFSSKPGYHNMYGLLGGDANAIEPHKRMLSSMSPTIVTKDGSVFMVIGTPGGPTIITTVLQCILNVIDHGMTIQAAVSAPRFHHQWYPDVIQFEDGAFTEYDRALLEEKGHSFGKRTIGDAQGILYHDEKGFFTGGADPRSFSSYASGF